ncbi:beta-phosphoglucomutase [Lachnospiraceae bacterium LCP25S3_G4]
MKAVIFDLDGVVVNTAKYHYLAWKKLAAELGFEFDIIHNEKLKGVSRMESLDIVLEAGGIKELSDEEKMKLATRKNGYYMEMIEGIDESEILPGVLEFLKKTKAEGYLISLGSASKSGKMILEKLNIADHFDAIVDGNLVELAKPNPQVFIKAAELLNVPCENCIVVEDAKAGVEAALAGNMKCIGVGDTCILGAANIVVGSTDKLVDLELEKI